MSLTISANFEVPSTYAKKDEKTSEKNKTEVFTTKLQGTNDKVEIPKKHTNPKLEKMMPLREVTIQSEDNGPDAIAARLGLNPQDLNDQLRDMKDPKTGKPLIPEGYKFDEVGHKRDLPWFKEGYKLKIRYPKTETEKENYENFVQQRRRDLYNRKAEKERKAKEAAEAAKAAQEAAEPWWKCW